jgi:hypothetical protein
VRKACPEATCSDQPANPRGRYVPGSASYADNPGLRQGLPWRDILGIHCGRYSIA